jgi:DNA replicative helicase MCM subunit Mcm2 (Cdc46/Mcm family)
LKDIGSFQNKSKLSRGLVLHGSLLKEFDLSFIVNKQPLKEVDNKTGSCNTSTKSFTKVMAN